MAGAIRHRGPDGYGIASGGGAGLVSTRLAIFDIPSGWQPMQGAHRDTVMVYNGEVFNHYELRRELEAQGERFRTTSDTEILLRLLDRDGPEALHRCNGQWGIAHLDRDTRTLTLMRDRFGVRPLHYAQLPDGGIVFSSEVKGILASGLVEAVPDLEGIDEVFTFWAARPPRCAFKGIRLLPPGHLLVWRDGEIVEERPWWEPRYAIDAPPPPAEELGELLRDSVRLRLRADVPVGCYLSGRPRLEPDDGAGRRADRPSAAHVLARVPRPALRRVGVPAPGRGGARHPAPRDRDRARGDHRRVPGRHAPPRDPGHPLGRRAALPAGAVDARAGHHGGRDGRGRRRAVLGLRPLQGSQGARVLRARARRRLARVAVRSHVPVLRRDRRPARRVLAALLPGRGPGSRSAVLAPDAHRGDLRRQVALLGRHARGRWRESIRSSACATTSPRSSAA